MPVARLNPDEGVRIRRSQASRRQATRADILKAATEVLHARGYSGATMAEIVQASGVSYGALQYHFPTKAKLMAAVADGFYLRRLVHYRRRLCGVDDPAERIRATIAASWEFALMPEFVAGLEIELARRTDPELRLETERLYRRQYAFLKLWTDILMRKLRLPDERAKEMWRFMNNALYRGLATLAIAGYPLEHKDEALAEFSTLFLKALGEERDLK